MILYFPRFLVLVFPFLAWIKLIKPALFHFSSKFGIYIFSFFSHWLFLAFHHIYSNSQFKNNNTGPKEGERKLREEMDMFWSCSGDGFTCVHLPLTHQAVHVRYVQLSTRQ